MIRDRDYVSEWAKFTGEEVAESTQVETQCVELSCDDENE